jgi:hypothetical protein
MITKEAVQKAYQLGTQKALMDAGLVKQARMPWDEEPGSAWWPATLGGIGGAIAAPSGHRLAGFGGAILGGTAGSAAGAAGGAGLGALLSLAAKNPEAKAALIASGLFGGSLAGAMGGSAYGYNQVMDY